LVALVGPELEENLSLRYLAASLERANVPCDIVPFNSSETLPRVVAVLCREPQPRVAALSLSFQWRALDVLGLAVALREQGFRGQITAGGHFASFEWRRLLAEFPELDTICRFEAEHTLGELVRAVIDGKSWSSIAGLALRNDNGEPTLTAQRRPPALDSLPWPDRRGPSANCLGHGIAALVGSRGCYGNCSFCCIATLHRKGSPQDRHRLRDVDDIAAEMADLQARRGIDIFIFHDDNFFLPRPDDSLKRVAALSDALERRHMRRFATVVKARPNDVTSALVGMLRERFGLIRMFLGVESSTQQGCHTLGRGVRASEAERALGVIEAHGLYVCFNMLVFDPDASIDGLLANMAFIEAHGEHPSNFGRVELYAGTPLLERLLGEGRAQGDYLAWNYNQATPEMQRVFELTIRAFYERNFSGSALANRLQSTRFDVEVARHFHPAAFEPGWLEAAESFNRRLARNSAEGVRRIVAHVTSGARVEEDDDFVRCLSVELRTTESLIDADATALETQVQRTIGIACDHGPIKAIPIDRHETCADR
jgi:radical SAM superfamily enzyme YgiQ (UPF0313 family)